MLITRKSPLTGKENHFRFAGKSGADGSILRKTRINSNIFRGLTAFCNASLL